MQSSDDRIAILFASQTGSAADVAENIGRQARRRHYRAFVSAIDDCSLPDMLEEPLVIFVTATTGQGEEPHNMRKFWQFLLRADLPSDLMDHCLFTVFGLGDSTYSQFNWPAKKLYRRMIDLGAQPFYEKGEGDDQDYYGIDSTLDDWLEGLWRRLEQIFPSKSHLNPVAYTTRFPPKLKISPMISTHQINGHHNGDLLIPLGARKCKITRNERATPVTHFQDVRYIEMETDSDLEFEAGDVVDLLPENMADSIQDFIELMGWENPDAQLQIEAASIDQPLPRHWPCTMSLRTLLTKYFDVFSVPRRSFFEMLAFFTTNQDETEKLREFASKEGQEDLWDYANRPRRTIVEVLKEFKSARKIPLEYLADLFPEMRTRSFSIANSAKMFPQEIHLLVAVVKYKTKLVHSRRGVCTTWLGSLPIGQEIPFTISKGTMSLPGDPSLSIICIGPGTGIAPFRAFIEERRLAQSPGSNIIFFGCRSRQADFFYEDEWERAQESNQVEFYLAPSRDQEDKIYVQHKIAEAAPRLWSAINEGAIIYICGSSKQMPKSVKKAFTKIFAEEGNMDQQAAEAYLTTLESQNRLIEETWA